MLQKILVVLIGLIMSLVGSLSPEGLFASQQEPKDPLGLGGALVREETLATVRMADKAAFARIPVLWAEVDGKRVVEDAWGTGEVKELRFKVGVKGVEGTALLVGERQVGLHPTDTLTVRMFRGDFSFRGMGTPQATLQLQGEVKTTTLSKGESANRLLTQVDGKPVEGKGGVPADGRVAYVVLTTGEKLDTVAVQEGGARLYTEEATDPAQARAEPGNLLAKWVRINGRMVHEYTYGEGQLDTVEFEPAEGATSSVVVAFKDAPTRLDAGVRATVKDFVGEYLVYQVAGGHLRLRLDGYAGDYKEGAFVTPPTATSGPGAPVAAFDFSPANPKTTDTIRFRDLSVDEGGEVVLRRWDFGDGSADVRRDPTHRYDKPGVYEVTLNVTDIDVMASQVKRTITVRNAEPLADFDFAPRRIFSGSLVAFTDLSRDLDGAVLNWTWDFGDGEGSHARHPVHRFAKGGNHTVTLTVTDDLGGVATLTKTVPVLNTVPRPAFGYAPEVPVSGAPVQFFDNSTDVDGTLVAWEWTFGDGGTARGPTPTYVFNRPGTFIVTLVVTDNAGGSATTTQTLAVANRPPHADFAWTPMGQPADKPVEFRSTSVDPDGLILLTTWDFGDGTTGARDSPVQHIFPRAGTYNVTITVTDNLMATTSLTRSVTIANAAPRADFAASPDPTYRGLPVNFTDLSRDPDGDAVAERSWDFGDGSPLVDGLPLVSHVYDRIGTFPVTLRVKDSNGNAAFATRPLQVLNHPPTGAISIEPGIPLAHRTVYLNATGSDRDSPGPLTYRWTFANGTTIPGQNVEVTFAAGAQTIVLRVVDSEGGQSSPIFKTFKVDLASPTAAFTVSPLEPSTGQTVNFTDVSLSPNGPVLVREWTIDGQTFRSSGPVYGHVFTRPGTFMVSLRVVDNQNQDDWFHQNVSVNGRPVAVFETQPGPRSLDAPVHFVDKSSDPEERPLSYHWDFGDGASSTQVGSVSHQYTHPGPKTVVLTVTDEKGAKDSYTLNVNLLNRRPTARWDLGTANPIAGQPVSFLSTGRAFDPDGADHLVGWSWTFGDGKNSSLPDPTHVFARSGLYTVNLQVTDGLLKSPVEPGSYKLVRIGADHPVTVTVVGRFPDGRPAPLLSDRFAISTLFGQPATGFETVAKGDYVPNGSALDLHLDAGRWLAGDQVSVELRDTTFMTFPLEKVATLVESDGLRTSVTLLFEIPLPLVATIDVDPGDAYASFLPVMPFRNGTATDTQEPIYRSPTEHFHGTGRVVYLDGVPAKGAEVVVQARYVPTAAVATAQDAADLDSLGGAGLFGWCPADRTFVDANGDYAWRFEGTDCLSTALRLYPAGRWEVRAVATYGIAQGDVSDAAGLWVDPTGGNLASLPLP